MSMTFLIPMQSRPQQVRCRGLVMRTALDFRASKPVGVASLKQEMNIVENQL